MKVYVCYYDHDWDGCSPPQRVFIKEEDAQEWAEDSLAGDYDIMEVE
jgi:hypothetical protein